MAAPTALPTRTTLAVADAAHTYYIDGVSGSDANAGTLAAPWKTLAKALNTGGVPIPGSGSNTPVRIVIRGTGMTITDTGPGSAVPIGWTTGGTSATADGYYLQANRRLLFPADSPLTITNYPGERVLMSYELFHAGDSNVRWLGTNVNGRAGIVFDPRYPSGAVNLRPIVWIGCTNMEACRIEIRNGIWNGLGGGIYVGAHSTYGPCVNPILWACKIHHNGGVTQGGHGVYWGGTTSGQAVGVQGGGVVNCIVAWNMDDNLSPHNCSVGSVFAHNLFLGWGGGASTSTTVATAPLTDTGYTRAFSDGMTFFAATSGQQSSDNMVVNNIFSHNKVYGLNQYDSSSGGGNVEKSNCFFANGTGTRRDASNTWQFLSTLTNADPLFVKHTQGDPTSDFHLQTNTPCAGVADIRFVPPDDFDGNTRSGADIGPYATSTGGGGGSSFPVVVGDFTEGTVNDTGYGNARAAMQVTVPAGGIVINEIHVWLQTYAGTTTARVGVYSDTSGAPGTLLAVSADQVLPANTIQEAVFPVSLSLAAGTVVWLAFGADTSGGGTIGPNTAILDAFARTENPLASGWAGPAVGGDNQLQCSNGKAGGSTAGTNNSSYWSTLFTHEQEAYFDINPANADQRLLLRLTNPGVAGGWNALECQFKLDTNVLTVREVLAGATTANRILITPGITMSSATRGLFRVRGTTLPTLDVIMEVSGTWTNIASFTYTSTINAALQGSGYIGARIYDVLGTRYFDNFAGGVYTVPAAGGLDMLVNPGTHVYNLVSGALPSSFGTPTVNNTYDMPIAAYGNAVTGGGGGGTGGAGGSRMLMGVGT